MKIIHAASTENKDSGWNGKAKAGDQTGKEVCIVDWYSRPWDIVLRYNNQNITNLVVEAAKKLANSNLVGYDQSQRNTLYKELKKNKFDVDKYIKSGVKTETDCSAFVYAVYACCLPRLRYDGNAPTTSTMRKFYMGKGFSCLTNPNYCNNANTLKHGDIVVEEGSHTGLIDNQVIITNNSYVDAAVTVIARDVIAGNWGQGARRKELLYRAIQDKVNEILKA